MWAMADWSVGFSPSTRRSRYTGINSTQGERGLCHNKCPKLERYFRKFESKLYMYIIYVKISTHVTFPSPHTWIEQQRCVAPAPKVRPRWPCDLQKDSRGVAGIPLDFYSGLKGQSWTSKASKTKSHILPRRLCKSKGFGKTDYSRLCVGRATFSSSIAVTRFVFFFCLCPERIFGGIVTTFLTPWQPIMKYTKKMKKCILLPLCCKKLWV